MLMRDTVKIAWIEAGSGLIKTEQCGLCAHRSGDFEPALVAIGQITGGVIGARHQIDAFQPCARKVDRLGFGFAE